MRSIKYIALALLFSVSAFHAYAQDVVVIDSNNYIRGTIKNTDYASVMILKDDATPVIYKANDVQEFMWNGETYISKRILIKKKMESRFFKALELGSVNLYAIGEGPEVEIKPNRPRISPSVGLGMGSGGFGGVGLGGGISFGGGRNSGTTRARSKAVYFIERPGTGPIVEIPLSDTKQLKTLLLSKLNNDEDLAERINETTAFDSKNIAAFVKAYNAMHK
ncbi:MAG: hypothetical protein EOO88_16905 [Pedobacter sp.]|nr:MAG: hypothetical protein EOO88_16905 [Pedobacter sp.]